MADPIDFRTALAEALDARRNWLDRTELPRLKDEFRLYQSAFDGLRELMLKKGILKEDPYADEGKIGDIKVPDEGPFTDAEKHDQMSIRLSNYSAQLDFLVNFYQYSTDFMTMERLKRIVGLAKYIAWGSLSSGTANLNTRTVSSFLGTIKSGNDALSSGIVTDAALQLDRCTRNAMKVLKELSDYHREAYKLEFRERVLDVAGLDPASAWAQKDETLRVLKRKFAETMSDKPFYPELVEEVLKEDFSPEGEALRADLLQRSATAQEKPKEEKKEIPLKATLMDGVRTLAMLSAAVSDGAAKLTGNSEILEGTKNTFQDKMRRLFRQVFNLPPESVLYEVELIDPVKLTHKTEKLDFSVFRTETEKKSRLLSALLNKTTASYKRLETASEEQALAMLSRNIEELQTTAKQMAALDEFFKNDVPASLRDRMRGVKPELATIKNGLIKANQKRHEYISLKEETEQMKKLGIDTNVV